LPFVGPHPSAQSAVSTMPAPNRLVTRGHPPRIEPIDPQV
jgi:hypothetical protein